MSSDKSVGQWVGSIIGAVVGIFNPGLGWAAGMAIGSAIGGLIDPPKGPTIHGPRLQDMTVQTSTFGAPIARVYGTVAINGNVIWLENNQLKEVVRKKKQGGKNGGGGSTVKTYHYYATFAVGLADAPPEGIKGVRRVWVGSELIYNSASGDLETVIASGRNALIETFLNTGNPFQDSIRRRLAEFLGLHKFAVYPGTDDQLPDYRIEAEMGVGNAPAFRGTAYIMFYDLPLEKWGNSLMGAQVKVELVTEATAASICSPFSTWSGPLPGHSQHGDRTALMLKGGLIHNYQNDGYVHKYRLDGRHVGRVHVPTPSSRQDRGRGVNDPYLQVVEDPSNFRLYLIEHGAGDLPIGPLRDGTGRLLRGSLSDSNQPLRLADGRVAISGSLATGVDGLLIYDGIILDDWREIPAAPGHTGAWCFDGVYIYIHAVSGLYQYDPETLDQLNYWSVPAPAHPSQRAPGMAVIGGRYFYVNDGFDIARTRIYQLHDDGSFTELCQLAQNSSWGFAVLDPSIAVMVNGPQAQFFSPARFTADGVSLADVVEEELSRSNLIALGDIDASELAGDSVRGYRLAGVQQVRACLGPLQAAYPFDLIMSGYQIKAVRRGKGSVVTIPIELLDARGYDDEPGIMLEQQREMDSQLPRQILLRHLDSEREHEVNEQRSSERHSTQAVDVREVDLPLVLTPDEAAQVADILFNVAWLERESFTFKLPPIYLGLEPADVITIDSPRGQFELRLVEVNYTPDGRLECRAKPNAAANYSSVAVGGEGPVPDGKIPLTGDAETVLMDIPLIRNEDDEPGFAAAMAGVTENWEGGVLFRSTDNGQTWTDVQAWASPVTMGNARAPLGAHDGLVIDRTSQLRVDIMTGELEGITEGQMMTGQNWAAYGADGRWELIRFADAALQSDGSYILSTLARGLRGSEWATGLHQEGDFFVLLDDPDVMGIGADLQALNIVRQWRGGSVGQLADELDSFEFAYRGVNLRPLSGVHGQAEQSGSDWVFSWAPRTRLQGSWWKTGVKLPVGEVSESYEVDILDGATVVRTLTSNTPTVTYTEAQQVEDFGSAQPTIAARVYQLSQSVGRGYPLEVSA